MRHLYLAGYRGTGKSSVASLLAQRLATPWVDLDAEVQRVAGRSIAAIFADSGEGEFRRLEAEALTRIAGQEEARIVALGGGAVLREENRRRIAESGRCFRLVASAETIARRIAADKVSGAQRPPLTSLGELEEIRQLLEARREAYEAVADYTVDADQRTPEEVANEITRLWRV